MMNSFSLNINIFINHSLSGLLIASNINIQISAKNILNLVLNNRDFLKNKLNEERLDYSLTLGSILERVTWAELFTPSDNAFNVLKPLLKGSKQILNYLQTTGLIERTESQSLKILLNEFDHLFEAVLKFICEYIPEKNAFDQQQQLISKSQQKQQEKINFIVKRISDVCSVLLRRRTGVYSISGKHNF
jgi:hypothetical protein